MVDTITPKMGLTKPEVGASANSWGNKINTNFDLLDQKVVRNTIQWTMTLGDEIPASAAGPYVIRRFNNAGVEVDAPLSINRQNGDVHIVNNVNVAKDLIIIGNIVKTGTLTVSAATFAVNAFIAASAAITAALSAASAAIAGHLTAASAAIGGHISANTIAANGLTSNGNINAGGQIYGNTVVAEGITSNGNMNAGGTISAPAISGTNTYSRGYAVWDQGHFGWPVTNGRWAYAGDYSHFKFAGMVEPFGGAALTGMNHGGDGSVTARYRFFQLYTSGWFTVGYV